MKYRSEEYLNLYHQITEEGAVDGEVFGIPITDENAATWGKTLGIICDALLYAAQGAAGQKDELLEELEALLTLGMAEWTRLRRSTLHKIIRRLKEKGASGAPAP